MPVFKRTTSAPYDFTFLQLPEFPSDKLIDSEFVYECTVTYDKRHIWTIGSIWNEGIDLTVQKILHWTLENNTQQIFCVCEYQKNLTPHLHMRVVTQQPVGAEQREKIYHGLLRLFGRSTFKPVELETNFREYLQKDLMVNYTKYGFPHWCLLDAKP